MKQLEDTDKMPFGKHKGELLQDVPADYFHWLWHGGNYKMLAGVNPLANYIERNIHAFRKENPDLLWQ